MSPKSFKAKNTFLCVQYLMTMYRMLKYFGTTLLLALLIVACAKRGSPTGGAKDETPPKFIKASPEPYTINFDADEIRIYFDEYVKLMNAQQQIIVSPPIEPKPNITPLGGPSKFIKIKFEEAELQPNTTYTINFGRSIEDHNEGNPLAFYKYVFSTGTYIDSLKLKGTVKDAFAEMPEKFITVALYQITEEITDSIIYNSIPRYVTNTLDSASTFQLENLKAGTYKLVAFKDYNNNYKFDPQLDKVGFVSENVEVPNDSVYELSLFKEATPFMFEKPKQAGKQHIIFGYKGASDSTVITLLSNTPDNFEYRQLKDRKTDTLHYWFKPFLQETDSLVFKVTSTNYEDTLVTRYRDQFQDSLNINKNEQLNLLLEKRMSLELNTPVAVVDSTQFSVVDKDTLAVPFKVSIDKSLNVVNVFFEATEANTYQIEILPNGITDFFGTTNDTLNYNLRTKEFSDFGDLFFTVENVQRYPIIVQLLDSQGALKYEQSQTANKPIAFTNIDPRSYKVRVIQDLNANGVWDTGSYLEGRQPEPVKFYPSEIEIRANSEIYQTFILK